MHDDPERFSRSRMVVHEQLVGGRCRWCRQMIVLPAGQGEP
jgi:hypothetical protein